MGSGTRTEGWSIIAQIWIQGQISGLSVRPVLQRQESTTDMVFQYVSSQHNKRKLRTLVPDCDAHPIVSIDLEHEPTAGSFNSFCLTISRQLLDPANTARD